ncbi:hypothetical protein [Ramlibacter henchirensis]|nr:hypothetical protein [Ramlibacter henchirensis]
MTELDCTRVSEVLVISTRSTGSNKAARRAALVAREQGWGLVYCAA